MVKAFVRDAALAFIEQLVKRMMSVAPTAAVPVFTDAQVTQAVDLAAKTGLERPWYIAIAALKAGLTLACSCGPRVIKEATFNLLGC